MISLSCVSAPLMTRCALSTADWSFTIFASSLAFSSGLFATAAALASVASLDSSCFLTFFASSTVCSRSSSLLAAARPSASVRASLFGAQQYLTLSVCVYSAVRPNLLALPVLQVDDLFTIDSDDGATATMQLFGTVLGQQYLTLLNTCSSERPPHPQPHLGPYTPKGNFMRCLHSFGAWCLTESATGAAASISSVFLASSSSFFWASSSFFKSSCLATTISFFAFSTAPRAVRPSVVSSFVASSTIFFSASSSFATTPMAAFLTSAPTSTLGPLAKSVTAFSTVSSAFAAISSAVVASVSSFLTVLSARSMFCCASSLAPLSFASARSFPAFSRAFRACNNLSSAVLRSASAS